MSMGCLPACAFQHTAARRRLLQKSERQKIEKIVSTHSRTKAAARIGRMGDCRRCSFNTQPHEGGCFCLTPILIPSFPVSTHSRTKAAASVPRLRTLIRSCFNTQPHEGGCRLKPLLSPQHIRFQHTAARRRLARWKHGNYPI